MSHSEIIIRSVVVQAAPGREDHDAEVEATVTYRPSDTTSPIECGKTVARILRRLPALADGPDE